MFVMTTNLREKLEGLKRKYEEVIDSINILKADGSLAKLCNLRDQFDETFDSFFDEIRTKIFNSEKAGLSETDIGHLSQRIYDTGNSLLEENLDEQELAELVKFYENYISELTDQFGELDGDLRYLDTKYGTVAFKGTEYTLTQQAYITNDGTDGDVCYKATAVDIKGVEYMVTWETTSEFDESQELYNLEQHNEDELSEEDKERMQELIDNEVNSALCEDEAEACDWDNPVAVNEI
jgi:hypothetical protein